MVEFEKALQQLNEKQREAVEAIEGPVMVVAGPGTGKTQILALRIANILQKTDTEPENILAITFTESGVNAMRKRLVSLIGSAGYRVSITTFHAFSNGIITEHPDAFPRIVASRPITNVEQIQAVDAVIRETDLELLKPFGDPLYYVRSANQAISTLKREGVAPDMFKRMLRQEEREFELIEDLYHEKGAHKGKMKGMYKKQEKHIAKNKELLRIYSAYEAYLTKKGWYDYADMIMEVIRVLEEDKDLLFSLQEQYQYVLVDEHQDTNRAQNRLLELLLDFHESPNIFVVGDEKQAIFRFQGASLDNFLYFKEKYKDVTLVTLNQNYRSHQVILDGAKSIVRSPLSKNQRLEANVSHEKTQILTAELPGANSELYCIGSHIADRLKAGAFPREVAVIYRDNRDGVAMGKMLEKLEVPFVIESNQNIFDDVDLKKLLNLFRAVGGFGDGTYLALALHADFFATDPLEVYALIERGKQSSLFAEMRRDPAFTELYEKLAKWRKNALHMGVTEIFEVIVEESGFLAHIMKLPDASEKLEKLNALFDEVKVLHESHPSYQLADFLEYLELLREHNMLTKTVSHTGVDNRVRLMTAHRAKGLEFPYVYIINAHDGHWGNRRRVEHFVLPRKIYSVLESEGEPAGADVLSQDDERNLFYVAMTRAEKEIVISYALQSQSGRDQLPSLFVTEIDEAHREALDLSGYLRRYQEDYERLLHPALPRARRVHEKEYVRALFSRRGLSVSGLNNYLSCPWKYFYRTLLRIPEAKTIHLTYGTVVHEALKCFFDLRNKEEVDKEVLLSAFRDVLSRASLSDDDRAMLKEKGETALSGYYDTYGSTWEKKTLNELRVTAPFSEDVHLTGSIDKIELYPNGSVTVVDYKTGAPKSRNALLGKTKSSTGDYHRQLVFYALLLQDFKDGAYAVTHGEIDFVEPDEKGRHKKERFDITKDEVTELRETVQGVIDSIWNISFWDERCGDTDCRYCSLQDMVS